MTPSEFKAYWELSYPATIPISHFFRHDYPDRWLRLHSLPNSKRYANSPEEWEILFRRQNEIVTELLGNNLPCIFVTGEFRLEGFIEIPPVSEIRALANLKFEHLEEYDLHRIAPEQYESGQMFKPQFSEFTWQPNQFNEILRAMADDELKGFFLSFDRNCIIAPYDGGIDIILADSSIRDSLKVKYSQWLSIRPDGL